MLKSRTSYFVGYDFEIHTQGRMEAKVLQAYMEKNADKRWLEDLRLPCVSIVTHDNAIDHIARYTVYYGMLMQNNADIINYLDFGFIPAAFYPTCYASENEVIDGMIESFGLTVQKFPAIYAGDVRFRNAHTDSWVSRFDISEVLNVPPEQVRTADIFRRVVYRETA